MGEALILAFLVWLGYLVLKARGGQNRPGETPDQRPRTDGTPTRAPTLRLTYQDFEGTQTTRDVTPYTRATNERFRAFCHLRGEAREFLFARVQSGIDLDTGESLDRAGVFRHIHPTRRIPADLQ